MRPALENIVAAVLIALTIIIFVYFIMWIGERW
mgnify:CR=1 FL=1